MAPRDRAARDRANETIQSTVMDTAKIVSLKDARGRRAARALVVMLQEADEALDMHLRELNKRLGSKTTFSVAAAQMYRAQIEPIIQYTQARLRGLTAEQADAAIQTAVFTTATLLEKLEEEFTGITRPLRLRQAAVMNPLISRVRSTVLIRHENSIARYGNVMIGDFEKIIRQGLLQGKTLYAMRKDLRTHGGPTGKVLVQGGATPRYETLSEGLFMGKKYWAARIVRTETAAAYETARQESLLETRAQDFPDMQKKILATFDSRTAYDSMVVHGQVRDLNGNFEDGAGRIYQHPPGRPNDRETVIPWRGTVWPETDYTTPKSESFITEKVKTNAEFIARQRARAAKAAARARSHRP